MCLELLLDGFGLAIADLEVGVGGPGKDVRRGGDEAGLLGGISSSLATIRRTVAVSPAAAETAAGSVGLGAGAGASAFPKNRSNM